MGLFNPNPQFDPTEGKIELELDVAPDEIADNANGLTDRLNVRWSVIFNRFNTKVPLVEFVGTAVDLDEVLRRYNGF